MMVLRTGQVISGKYSDLLVSCEALPSFAKQVTSNLNFISRPLHDILSYFFLKPRLDDTRFMKLPLSNVLYHR